jgi:1-acyl-sn-glycerol-3-phosphate acyltransferase
MLNLLITIAFIFFFFVTSAFFFFIALVIWLLTSLFDRRLVLLHLFTSAWAVFCMKAMPVWSLDIEGREKIKKGETYVIVSNHQSQLDILSAFGIFFPFKWVSKAEVFRIPFVGWNMSLNRYIKLIRDDRKSVLKMFRDAERALSKGSSVFFFPEGTRSETGVIGQFMPGAFVLAKRMKVPVLPVAINGTGRALPKGSLRFHGRQKIRVRVLDEITSDDYAGLSAEELAARARDLIAENVDKYEAVNNV